MESAQFKKICLSLLFIPLFFISKSTAVEISGKAKTVPKSGFIALHGRDILLHGIQIISLNATCQDSNGQWSCGESAWEALKNKLDSGLVQCSLISDRQIHKGNTKMANCIMKKENLSKWLVSQGWALTNKDPNEFLLSQESLASQNHAGIWRGGFIPPDIWRVSFKKDSKHCSVCSTRRQSFLQKKKLKQKSPR